MNENRLKEFLSRENKLVEEVKKNKEAKEVLKVNFFKKVKELTTMLISQDEEGFKPHYNSIKELKVLSDVNTVLHLIRKVFTDLTEKERKNLSMLLDVLDKTETNSFSYENRVEEKARNNNIVSIKKELIIELEDLFYVFAKDDIEKVDEDQIVSGLVHCLNLIDVYRHQVSDAKTSDLIMLSLDFYYHLEEQLNDIIEAPPFEDFSEDSFEGFEDCEDEEEEEEEKEEAVETIKIDPATVNLLIESNAKEMKPVGFYKGNRVSVSLTNEVDKAPVYREIISETGIPTIFVLFDKDKCIVRYICGKKDEILGNISEIEANKKNLKEIYFRF